ncbi:MAG: flagellar export chaperone FliS [Candidatus Acidiferrum sp.]|jgi:flagellar protein FliS
MTNNRNAAQSYLQDHAKSASAVGGVVALFDTILRDFKRAEAALAAGNIEVRVSQLNHALLVIAELHGVLDYARGGEVAKRFARFYEVSRGLVLAANLRCTPEALQQLIEMYTPVRQAWKTVEQKLPVTEIRQGEACKPAPLGSMPADESETTGGRWAA